MSTTNAPADNEEGTWAWILIVYTTSNALADDTIVDLTGSALGVVPDDLSANLTVSVVSVIRI